MEWTKAVLALLGSVGGIGAVFVAVVKFSSGIIAERLSKQYQLELDQAKEKYKAQLSKKEYVSKTRFDAEFVMYQEISKAFFNVAKNINSMIPSGYNRVPADEDLRRKLEEANYEESRISVVIAQDTLYRAAPFISEAFYEKYLEIISLSNLQLNAYLQRYNVLDLRPKEEKESYSLEDYKRSKEILVKLNEINGQLREYLFSLEVIE